MLFPLLYAWLGTIAQPCTDGYVPFKFNEREIKIEVRLKPSQLRESGTIRFGLVEQNVFSSKTNSELKTPIDGLFRFSMKTDGPSFVDFSNLLLLKRRANYLVEPGDSIVITSNGDELLFSGTGATKLRLQYRLDSLERNLQKPNNKTGQAAFYIDSVAEYFQFEHYFQNRFKVGIVLIDSYKGTISDYAFNRIRDRYILNIYGGMGEKFGGLQRFIEAGKVAPEKVVRIYDSSYSPLITSLLDLMINKQQMQMGIWFNQIERAYGFDPAKLPDFRVLQIMEYEHALKSYKGAIREEYILTRLPELMLKAGFTPKIEQLIADYYSEPGFPDMKSRMKTKEREVRRIVFKYKTPELAIPDKNGELLTKEKLKGKIAVLFFEGDHTVADKSNKLLKASMEKFKDHPSIAFVTISTEKNNAIWQKDISARKKIKNSIHTSTGGLGTAHPVIREYAVAEYPWIWVMDQEGKILNSSPVVDFTKDNGGSLAGYLQQLINADLVRKQKERSISKDGPYIFHEGNNSTVYWIDSTRSKKMSMGNKAQQLEVQTDLNKTFSIQLQQTIADQSSVYPAAEKMIVFSDIEGNFDALRKLLQSNKIIDEQFNWIYGNGHLVFAGDMFDRGNQVTECLWLMYNLEEKAKKAGGFVHFILGNHDIMNMQGNYKYATRKYHDNAAVIGKTISQLYNEDSEIGRWLRTKNVIERIGDILFLHGGISPEVNRLPLTIEQINLAVRPYYGRKVDSTNTTAMTLYDSRKGEAYRISPFWSRGYYQGKKVSDQLLDSTLNKFGVKRIVTGHTIVADTVSVHYDGKVINTDTKHAQGKTEALLIEGEHYYRVNAEGKRVLLFIDDRKKLQ